MVSEDLHGNKFNASVLWRLESHHLLQKICHPAQQDYRKLIMFTLHGCNIKFISPFRFNDLKEKYKLNPLTENSKDPWTSYDIVHLKRQAYSEGAFNCAAGGIQNGNQVTLFHLFPHTSITQNEKRSIQTQLIIDANHLRKRGAVHGLISGGHAFCYQAHPNGLSKQELKQIKKDSKELKKQLEKAMKTAGIKYISIIWGRRNEAVNGSTNVMYRAEKNRWYISTARYLGDMAGMLSLKDLKKTFTQIHLALGDTLKVGGQLYSATDLSKNPFKKLAAKFRPKSQEVMIPTHTPPSRNLTATPSSAHPGY
jgi:hypothetical protein